MSLVRCKTCVLPTTRPDTHFEDGECSACRNARKADAIDWKSRESELLRILETMPRNGSGFDCIVPSSAGKDSTYQVLRLIELGVRPLVVTATTCMLTDVGRKNIDNLARYATTIEITPNREVRRKLNRLGFQLVGDPSLPEHMAIFSIPFRMAADLGISTVWYGENPQWCYGSPPGAEEARVMTRRWTMEHGGYLGLRPQDFVGMEGITAADMKDYMLPSDEKMAGVTAYWLGQYERWDSHRNLRVAADHGMVQPLPCTANWWRGENVDCFLTGFHDHAMYRKYGYGRGCAQISVDIRNGLVPRDEALGWIELRDGEFPFEYMGGNWKDIGAYIGMHDHEIIATLEQHTNHDLFDGEADFRPILKEFASRSRAA